MEDVFEVHFRDLVPSEDRMKVIAVSVRIEDIIGICLSRLLGIREPKYTTSFGSSSMALSFNAKLNLFLDLKGITKEHVDILTKFSYMRNKFAHLVEIETVYDCLEAQKGKEIKKFFEKKYRDKVDGYEYNVLKVREMFSFFIDDVEDTAGKILIAMFDKIGDEKDLMMKAKRTKMLLDNFLDIKSFSHEERLFVKRVLEKMKKDFSDYDFTDEVLALI
jgi:ACT domain-containing protein